MCLRYMQESEDTFSSILGAKGSWPAIMAYYCCYHAFYSVLMKTGIRSEIHECTIELTRLFGFTNEEMKFLHELKENRIDVQYYLLKPKPVYMHRIKHFVQRCRDILSKLDENRIREIRGRISQATPL